MCKENLGLYLPAGMEESHFNNSTLPKFEHLLAGEGYGSVMDIKGRFLKSAFSATLGHKFEKASASHSLCHDALAFGIALRRDCVLGCNQGF